MNSPLPVLVADHISKIYTEVGAPVAVFNQLTFTVLHGELIAIVGASGAGKSTLLHILGGLDVPTSGSVFVAGERLDTVSAARKSELRNHYLGFVYQFHHLLPELTALENVCVPLLIRGVAPKHARPKASRYLEAVGLKDRMLHRMGELSGGERQRVAIARALVTEPVCILADEPTGNLDEKTAGQMTELLLQLNAEFQTSFVIVTHNMALAHKMHRTKVLENGVLK